MFILFLFSMDINKIKSFAEEVFSKSRGSHDWEHTLRVYNLCMHIGKKENANLDVLQVSAFLHDIARHEQDSSGGKICHAEKGAQDSKIILKDFDFSDDFIEEVVHCIETHRFRNSKEPFSKEAKILFDADKLDSIGAVGIGRAFLFSGEIGAKLHNKNVDVYNTEEYTIEDTAYREYLAKLKHVKGKILTAEGKRIAEERHAFMEEFFNRLNDEVDGNI